MCKISVIMSTYNEQEQHLRGAIESICSQTFEDFEFLIVLDNPENHLLAQVVEEYAKSDARIRVLKNPENLGLVASLNRALGEATGDYIARMDADDYSTSDRLEKELAALQEQQLDLIGTLVKRMDEEGNLLPGLDTQYYNPETIMHTLMVTDCIPHPSWLVKKEVYAALGGYRFIDRCEDYDFLLRALKKGYRLGLCPHVLLHYRIVTKGISQSGLLRQRLSAKYLTRHFDRLEEITMEEIRQKVFDKISPRESAHYLQANALFLKAMGSKRNLPKFGIYLLAALCRSRHQLPRFMDTAKIKAIRKKYR